MTNEHRAPAPHIELLDKYRQLLVEWMSSRHGDALLNDEKALGQALDEAERGVQEDLEQARAVDAASRSALRS